MWESPFIIYRIINKKRVIIKTKSFPRAALIGNPSDGYYGKTIAFIFSNFSAEVTLYQTPELEITPAELDTTSFQSVMHLVDDVKLNGYYGGFRLLKAAIKRFCEYCSENNILLDNRNFTIRYRSNIPIRLGLAGSSAIITACMKALMNFYGIEIPKPVLANLILSVETEGYGEYLPIKPELFPNLYIAYRTDLSEGSEVVHNNLRERYNYNEPEVLKAISEWADLTRMVKKKLEDGQKNEIGELLNRNFDIRRNIMTISEKNLQMIEKARSTGASAKFTGSGGAIIGTFTDDEMFIRLKEVLSNENIEILKPQIVAENES